MTEINRYLDTTKKGASEDVTHRFRFGGTNVIGALIDSAGNILRTDERPTQANKGKDHVELIRGASWSTGEIGHMILYPWGKACNCGQYGMF